VYYKKYTLRLYPLIEETDPTIIFERHNTFFSLSLLNFVSSLALSLFTSTNVSSYIIPRYYDLIIDAEVGEILEVLVLEYDFAGTRTLTRTRE